MAPHETHTLFELAGEDAGRSATAPDDLLEESRRRLSWACVAFILGFVLAHFLPNLVFQGVSFFGSLGDYVGLVALMFAAALAVTARTRRIRTKALLALGLAFEVAGSFAIATAECWWFFAPAHVAMASPMMLHGISWVCVWIVIFPALVPARVVPTVAATLLSAMATPLVLAASEAYHRPAVAASDLANVLMGASIANAVAAGLAILVASVIRGLGREIQRARRMGSYTLVERLGGGGMGDVWRAEHRMLARPAAVKLVRSDLAETSGEAHAQAVKRFEIEAQATASLRSPHTIQLYDFGVAHDGRLYYVMELLDGIDLDAMVRRFGPLPPARAAHLIRQACLSLEEAHTRGLVHRDIKPANLMCCRQGIEHDFVKVLDFGVVRAIRGSAGTARLTGDLSVVGTPAFLAPETILGEREPDARADLYALGCVAYWLLAGRLVFEGDTAMRVAVQHVEAVPEPPSRFAAATPPELDRAVLACLAKDPERRPQSAAEVREMFSAVRFEAPWTAAHALEWWSRHGDALRG